MLTYSFDHIGKETLYEHLYRSIRRDIESGEIRAGERLPSKRALAQQLSVSTITVENAYAQLLTEGYIYSVPRSGYFAADIGDLIGVQAGQFDTHRNDGGGRDSGADRADMPEENAGAGMQAENTGADRMDVQPEKRYFADFGSNQTEPGSFPFSIWAKLSREVLSRKQEELMTNPPAGGVMELREAIAGAIRDFRGLSVRPEQIIIGAGTDYLYGLLFQLLGLERCYAQENPGYRRFEQVLESYHLRHVPVPIDASGLSVQMLKKTEADVVHVTPSHHFPTGITMPVSRRRELLHWAAGGKYIIEDDYDSEFRMSGRPLPTLFGMDPYGCVIYMNTFTKTLSSTVRVSYMVLPEKLLEEYRRKLGFYACPVSTFEQYTLARFISQGYFEKHINRMRTRSRRKRNLLLTLIGEGPLGGSAEISEEDAGLHFLMKIHSSKSAGEISAELETEGIRLPLLEDGESFMVNYSSVPIERLPEAVKRIAQAAAGKTQNRTSVRFPVVK